MTDKNKNQNQSKSVEDALGQRAQETPPQESTPTNSLPPEHNDLVNQAMQEERTEQLINGATNPPQVNIPETKPLNVKAPMPKMEEITPPQNQPIDDKAREKIEKVIQDSESETLVSNTDLLTEVVNCSQESPPQKENQKNEDSALTALKSHISAEGFNETAVEYMIIALCSTPSGLPYPVTWDSPYKHQISKMVFNILREPGYLDNIWNYLKIIMGSNADNSAWSANVTISIALYDAVRFLPLMNQFGNTGGVKE